LKIGFFSEKNEMSNLKLSICSLLLSLSLLILGLHYFFVYQPFVFETKRKYDALISMSPEGEKDIIDQLGVSPYLRGIEKKSGYVYFEIKKPRKIIRIGCFGDSHTFGQEVGNSNDYPSLLQNILGPHYQVLNFGIPALSSDQVYSLIERNVNLYQIDIILLGPRGFYRDRSSTFNQFWQSKRLPHSRFLIKNQTLYEVNPPGKNMYERIENYYSLFPDNILLLKDNTPPSFLKLGSMLLNLSFENPFYNEKKYLAEVENIQVKQIEKVLKLGKPIFFLTDLINDYNLFNSIKEKNFNLFKTDMIPNEFPFRANFTHPSPLGYYVLAKNFSKILKNEKIMNKNQIIPVLDQMHSLHEVKLGEVFKIKIKIKNVRDLQLKVNGLPLGSIESGRGYDLNGHEVKYGSENLQLENRLFVGIYNSSNSIADALFLSVNADRISSTNLPFKKIQQWGNTNVIFIESDAWSSHFRLNIIEINKNLFNEEVIQINGKTILKKIGFGSYKFNVDFYRVIIDKFFDVFDVVNRGIPLKVSFFNARAD
jgi:hypothetical protein